MSGRPDSSGLSKGLSNHLDKQRGALQQWRAGYTNRQTDSLLRVDGDVLEEVVTSLENQHEQHLRDMPVLKSPEERAKSLLNDLELQIFELKQAEERRRYGVNTGKGSNGSVFGGGSNSGGGAAIRAWERNDKFEKSAETEALEQVLLEVQDGADDLVQKINREPPVLGARFVQDVESLIHQNVILKNEAQRCNLDIISLGDEVSKLREDQTHNQKAYAQLVKRLQSVSADRDALSEKLRNGICQAEKDEYAKEIQRLHSREVRSRKEFIEKFGNMQGTIDAQHEKIQVLEREIERLKKINMVQEEEFKTHISRLIRDKRALRHSNDKMNRLIFNAQRLQSRLDQELEEVNNMQ